MATKVGSERMIYCNVSARDQIHLLLRHQRWFDGEWE